MRANEIAELFQIQMRMVCEQNVGGGFNRVSVLVGFLQRKIPLLSDFLQDTHQPDCPHLVIGAVKDQLRRFDKRTFVSHRVF